MIDFEHCYGAVERKDARFDGWFFTTVLSTGVYCRPSCPARTPLRRNVRFVETAAAAQAAGFRACKRCRPDASPGSPEWDARGDLAGRAMTLIADGVVDRDGVAGLAGRLGYTERHLNRQLTAALGAGPLALARSRRAQNARLLLETSELKIGAVALTAGFASVRQFNSTIRDVFGVTPRELRAEARRDGLAAEHGLSVTLPARAPLAADALIEFLARRAVPGVEERTADGTYRRSLRLAHGQGIAELAPDRGAVRATLYLDDASDFGAALNRCRRLLDLDSDPLAVRDRLAGDPLIGAAVRRCPGRRVPGTVDGDELALRAVLGQQISLAAARTAAGRLVRTFGEPLARPLGAVTHTFPSPAALAESDPGPLAMPRSRARALIALARALAAGELALDGSADREEARRALLAMPGIGEWTAGYIAMRALRDPDAFIASDLGIRRALERLGSDGGPRGASRAAERWRPYRAYAAQHLWAGLAESASRNGSTTTKTTMEATR